MNGDLSAPRGANTLTWPHGLMNSTGYPSVAVKETAVKITTILTEYNKQTEELIYGSS